MDAGAFHTNAPKRFFKLKFLFSNFWFPFNVNREFNCKKLLDNANHPT